MKKRIIATLLTAVMAISLMACGGGNSSSSSSSDAAAGDAGAETEAAADTGSGDAEYTIKIGHSDTTTNLIHVSLENFAAYVNEQSQGQIANYCPKINALGLPFLFSDYESVYKVLDSEIGDELVADFESRNMIQLAYWENGLRQVTNSKKAITAPADLAGLKIRTPEDKMTIAIFEALGASPSPLAFSELYLALQQGTFDGQENPVSNIYANNFADVQKYISMTNHKYECKNMVFSLTSWNKYPEDVQNLLKEAAKKFGDEHRKAIVDSQAEQLAALQEKGMEVTEPDLAPFQEATKSVYDDFYAQYDWAEDLVSRIQAKMAE